MLLLAAQAAADAPPPVESPSAAVRQRPGPFPPTTPSPPPAPGRAAENAVTQAEDAFGFSVGRETLGLYSSSNVRGFSPFAAGNVRIEGLYFDPYLTLLMGDRRLDRADFSVALRALARWECDGTWGAWHRDRVWQR